VLNLVTEIFGSSHTNFTFVGDPKQNIMGFAGARRDIFAILKEKFPNETHSVIVTSFRLPQEIAEFANDFIRKFMNSRSSIQTVKSNNDHKPQIIIVGQKSDYQLSHREEKEVEEELEQESPELTKKRSEVIREKIRTKKLKRHLETILPIVNRLDSRASKAILYRKNWIGKLLQKWLDEKGITTNISEAIVTNIVRKVRQKLKNFSGDKFSSLRNFLASLKISESSIFQLTEIIRKIDEGREVGTYLTREQINNFTFQLEEETMKNHQGVILSTIHGMKGLEADHVFLIFCDKEVLPRKETFSSE